MELDFQAIIDTISKWYYQSTGLEVIKSHIEFTDNIYKRKLELESNDKQREFFINNKEYEKNVSGTIILSERLNELPYILISTKTTENNSFQYVSTITHELTHLHDFYDIINYYKLKYSKEFYDNKKCCLFTNWSEYHAVQNGYTFFKNYEFNNSNITKEELFNFIKQEELPFQFNKLMDDWIECQNNLSLKAKYLMKFLGRFSVWQKWFPDKISILMPFADDENVIDIYNFLLLHNSFEKIVTSLDEFDKILYVK